MAWDTESRTTWVLGSLAVLLALAAGILLTRKTGPSRHTDSADDKNTPTTPSTMAPGSIATREGDDVSATATSGASDTVPEERPEVVEPIEDKEPTS